MDPLDDDRDDATHPDADTCEPQAANPVPSLALVLLWSAAEPHRVGEIAFFPGSGWWFIGRGDDKIDEFAQFVQQCPSDANADARSRPFLRGKTMSARQLAVRVHNGAIEMNQLGTCLTLVNGKPAKTARLTPGDTVLIRGVGLFLCVRRPRVLPPLGTFRELIHAFGDADDLGIVGESLASWTLRYELAAAARSPFHVLIRGDSGVGKEMAAAAIHKLSARRQGAWVTSSAAVSTDTLIELKLFGRLRGFPNPGTPAMLGLFPAADKGTLFLDEIADCPEDYQKALLRTMATCEGTVLGESLPRRFDVRVVAATNRDLALLRPELYWRLKKRVRVPPLRERREDIPLFVRHLALKRAVDEPELMERFFYTGPSGRTELRVSGRVIDYLVRHPLEGNMRELEVLLDGFISTSTGNEVRLPTVEQGEGVGPESAEPVSGAPVSREPASAVPVSRAPLSGRPSEEQVRAALTAAEGVVRKAAKALGMSSTSLYRLIEEYGIERGSVVGAG